jgi:hypothetical protein
MFNGTTVGAALRADSAEANGTTEAVYLTFFSPEVYYNNASQDVFTFIKTNVTARLMAASVSGSPVFPSVNATMQKAVDEQNDTFSVHPCQEFKEEICDVCYPCDDKQPVATACQLSCLPADHKKCGFEPQTPWVSVCSCESHYLPVGDSCVNEDIIIGVSAGVGGAIVVGLVVAFIVILCTGSSSSKKRGNSSADSERNSLALDDLGHEYSPVHADNAVLVPDEEEAALPHHEEPAAPVVAAAVVTAAAVAAVVEEQQHQPQQQQPVTPLLEQQAQQLIDQIPAPDYDYGPTTTFSTFAPQLQYVDTTRDYSIRRPNVGYASPGFGSPFKQPQYSHHQYPPQHHTNAHDYF